MPVTNLMKLDFSKFRGTVASNNAAVVPERAEHCSMPCGARGGSRFSPVPMVCVGTTLIAVKASGTTQHTCIGRCTKLRNALKIIMAMGV